MASAVGMKRRSKTAGAATARATVAANARGKTRAASRLHSLNLRAKAKIYLKDPLVSTQRKSLYSDVYVSRDNLITHGPTSSRFIVVDYDGQTDRVEPPAHYRKVQERDETILEFRGPVGSAQEAQINAWATAIDTLDLFQQPLGLGREVPWAFEGSRLRILPHAGFEANAFYSRETRALHFGYFTDRSGTVIKTSLSHDVVAHETAHAVLDGLRPFYLDAHDPETGAFHEFIGDLAAMLSFFREIEPLVEVARATKFGDLVSSLAPQVGVAVYGDADRNFLRSAENKLTYDKVKDEPEVHRRSQVLTGFAFDFFEAVYRIRLKQVERRPPAERKPGKLTRYERVREFVVAARRNMVRMLLRPLDYLPPGSIGFTEYIDIVLRLDEAAYPDDRLGYRKELRRVAERRGLLRRDGKTRTPSVDNRKLLLRNIYQIRSSRVGAYRFINANRPLLAIPEDVDVRVIAMATNRREGDDGVFPARETIIQYVWDRYIDLTDAGMEGDALVVHPGGTLVIDDNVNVLSWAPQDYDEQRVRDTVTEVKRLVEGGEIDHEPKSHLRSDRRVVARREDTGALSLRINTSLMHRERGRV